MKNSTDDAIVGIDEAALLGDWSADIAFAAADADAGVELCAGADVRSPWSRRSSEFAAMTSTAVSASASRCTRPMVATRRRDGIVRGAPRAASARCLPRCSDAAFEVEGSVD